MGPEFLIMMLLLLGGLLLMNQFAKRSQAKRTAERDKMLNEAMVPGAWIQTFSGFFGRYVDTDGDVIILETPKGEETYWLKAAVKGVIEPPFEVVEDEEAVVDAIAADADADDIDEKFRELVQEETNEDDGTDTAK